MKFVHIKKLYIHMVQKMAKLKIISFRKIPHYLRCYKKYTKSGPSSDYLVYLIIQVSNMLYNLGEIFPNIQEYFIYILRMYLACVTEKDTIHL